MDARPGLMSASRTWPGHVEHLRDARHWVRDRLAAEPDAVQHVAETIVCELATNAVRHTASGCGGGKVEVLVEVAPGSPWVWVGVVDEGSDSDPVAGGLDGGLAESGRGLGMVAALAVSWGWEALGAGRVVWATIAR